jgi:hypothetical protein
VLLATCFADEELAAIEALEGQHVRLDVTPNEAVVATVDEPIALDASGACDLSSADNSACVCVRECSHTMGFQR